MAHDDRHAGAAAGVNVMNGMPTGAREQRLRDRGRGRKKRIVKPANRKHYERSLDVFIYE
jgi:hypothetical protein